MGLASGFDSLAKALTKDLGTTGTLKDKTVGTIDPVTYQPTTTITDIPIQIAPWTSTKLVSSPNDVIIEIGDVLAVCYVDTKKYPGVEIQKDEKIVMAGKTYDVIHVAQYIPEGITVAYYVVMRLSAS